MMKRLANAAYGFYISGSWTVLALAVYVVQLSLYRGQK